MAVPGHACDGILMGYFLGLAKVSQVNNNNKQLSKKYITSSILIPMVTHGIYDYCLFFGDPIFLVLLLDFVVFIYIYCIKKVKHISKNVNKFIYQDKFCPNCGNPVNSEFCPQCGRKNE